MAALLNRIVTYLSSIRFTTALLITLAVIFLLGLWIPQRGVFTKDMYLQWLAASPLLASSLDRIGFTHIYSSPFTIVVWFFFFLNLALVMWKRVPLVRRRIALGEANLLSPASSTFSDRRTVELSGSADAAQFMEKLAREGYAVFGTPDHFCGVKNRYSAVANLLFHLSFFLILLGGLIGIYTNFRGNVVVAEGESFNGELERYDKGLKLPLTGEPPKLSFRVEKILPEISGDTATQLYATVVDARGKRHTARINHPYVSGNAVCVLKKLGIAPLLVVRDKEGHEVDGAYIRLDVLKGKEDRFTLAGYNFTAQFYPDYVKNKDEEYSQSLEFKNPVLRMTEFQGEQKVKSSAVPLGGSFSAGDSTITFAEMPYWVSFQVVNERGAGIVYFGVFLAAIVLAWRLFFYRKDIVCKVAAVDGRQVLQIGWRTEFYRALAGEELDKLLGKIQGQGSGRQEQGTEIKTSEVSKTSEV